MKNGSLYNVYENDIRKKIRKYSFLLSWPAFNLIVFQTSCIKYKQKGSFES